MKKLINHPAAYVDEALDGLAAAFPAHFRRTGSKNRVMVRTTPKKAGRIGLASGGGFGHLPLFAGYVGQGLLDTCAVGDVFAGPSMDSVTDALNLADRGAGVLAVLGNYGGDKMAFATAAELLAMDGAEIATVIVNDDVASAGPDEREKRRGVAGLILAYKVAGAAAEAGYALNDAARLTERAVSEIRTIGVALTPCIVPTAGRATFELPENSIEMGMGIHGEKGVWRGPLPPADSLVAEMLDRILSDLRPARGRRVAVLVNSLGATPLEELCILYRAVEARLAQEGLMIAARWVGPLATSMEMAGASITLMALDAETERMLAAPADCPFWRAG